MLYLFGRLALSDSFYFNQDIYADEQPDTPPARRQPEAPGRTARAAAPSSLPHRGSSRPLASLPPAESAS